MYITVMDYSTKNVATLVWNVEKATTEEVEILLQGCGYHLSQIDYMTSEEEPEYSIVEVSDILPEIDM